MTIVWLGCAGALGAIARYGLTLAMLRSTGPGFPWGTLAANLAGCFALGFLAEFAFEHPEAATRARAVVGAGFLGAFTTFSTFGVETYRAFEAGLWGVVAANVALNLLGGLLLVAAGFAVARGM